MKKELTKRQRAIRRRNLFLTGCVVLLAAVIIGAFFGIRAVVKLVGNTPENTSDPQNISSVSSEPETPHKVSSATVVNTGDILVHSTQLDGAKRSDGTYDFTAFFPKLTKYFNEADYSVANLEITFGGREAGKFSGYPAFNTPDELADVLKDAGLKLLLTANNHCYDTGLAGLKRTLQIVDAKGFDHIGTKQDSSDPTYIVKDVNGIKIGMACYTYENTTTADGRKSINGNLISTEANDLINSFSYDHLETFYASAEQVIAEMKQKGADCVVFYMHWGNEYQLTENNWQRTIAQKLCDFGVDVIVGGHPHVVQPMALLHSSDSQRTTVCLYSMGNAISNQRQEIMHPECTTGHTEDGVLFYYTFDKYSDGTTVLSGVDLIPTWVDKYRGQSGYLYTVYPLENSTDGSSLFGLEGTAAKKSQASYERTKETVKAGLTECQNAVGCQVRFPE